jgi:hypothetical protein
MAPASRSATDLVLTPGCSPVGAAGLVRLIGRPLVRRRGSHAVAQPVASRSGSPAEGVHGSHARRNSERLLSRTCSWWPAGAARPPTPCPLACSPVGGRLPEQLGAVAGLRSPGRSRCRDGARWGRSGTSASAHSEGTGSFRIQRKYSC